MKVKLTKQEEQEIATAEAAVVAAWDLYFKAAETVNDLYDAAKSKRKKKTRNT